MCRFMTVLAALVTHIQKFGGRRQNPGRTRTHQVHLDVCGKRKLRTWGQERQSGDRAVCAELQAKDGIDHNYRLRPA